MLTYATACSGIDAPGTAWQSLGWRAVFHSEIEPFPCDVLAAREPDVPNLGNMEAITREQIEGFKPVSVFVAGTPCQSFSVAGLRKGMADPRGNLALIFLRLVDWLRPAWVVWENVPGVHSSWSDVASHAPSEGFRRDLQETRRIAESAGLDLGTAFDPGRFEEVDQSNDFDCFLAALEQLGYGVATKVFDAQHFGVPQRRRRVFVVGHLGDWRRAAAVLFERFSLSGDPAPSREAGARTAACLTRGADSGGKGGYAGRRREDDFNIVNCMATGQASAEIAENLCPTLNCDHEQPIIAHSLRADGFDASEDGTGRGTPLVVTPILEAGKRCGTRNSARDGTGIGAAGDPMFTLQSGAQHAVAFAQNQRDEVRTMEVVGALASEPGMKQQTYIAYQCQGSNVGPMGAVRAGNGNETGGVPFVFGSQMSTPHFQEDLCDTLQAKNPKAVQNHSGVRRLLPVECEKLQGFPPGHTAVKHRGKPASDAPRYKAIGNSMAVPVLLWIGRRIEAVEAISPSPRKAVTT